MFVASQRVKVLVTLGARDIIFEASAFYVFGGGQALPLHMYALPHRSLASNIVRVV